MIIVNSTGLFKGKFDLDKPSGLYIQELGVCELCGVGGVLATDKKQYDDGDKYTYDFRRSATLPTIHFLQTFEGRKYEFLCWDCHYAIYRPEKEDEDKIKKGDMA